MAPIEILGIGAALIALVAFIGNQYGALRASSFWYDALNFLSAAGLFVYAYNEWVVPFMLTNAVWGFVSGMDVIRHFQKGAGLKKRGK